MLPQQQHLDTTSVNITTYKWYSRQYLNIFNEIYTTTVLFDKNTSSIHTFQICNALISISLSLIAVLSELILHLLALHKTSTNTTIPSLFITQSYKRSDSIPSYTTTHSIPVKVLIPHLLLIYFSPLTYSFHTSPTIVPSSSKQLSSIASKTQITAQIFTCEALFLFPNPYSSHLKQHTHHYISFWTTIPLHTETNPSSRLHTTCHPI